MIRRIDGALLSLTEKIVKRFNWLTGKDNFFLARQLIIASNVALLGDMFLAGTIDLLLAFIIQSLGSIFVLFPLISDCERISEDDAQRGAKQAERTYAFFVLRIIFLFACSIITLGILLLTPYLLLTGFAIIQFVPFMYLISIDKPPYARSMIWKHLKSFFASLAPAPQQTLVPIPVDKQ